MSHDYHQGAPNYSPDQLLHDNCAECASRSANPWIAIDHFDMKAAWRRAYKFGKSGLPDVSLAEAPILRTLWAIIVQLERSGVPLGAYPGDLATVLREEIEAQRLLRSGPAPLADALAETIDHLADPTGT